jgi:hypothetical protein
MKQMKIKEDMQKEYAEGKAKNTDPYGAAIFRYSERWARRMEEHLEEHGEIEKKTVDELSNDADNEGITGFMYDMARSILYDCWVYGEELKDLLGNKMTSMMTIEFRE